MSVPLTQALGTNMIIAKIGKAWIKTVFVLTLLPILLVVGYMLWPGELTENEWIGLPWIFFFAPALGALAAAPGLAMVVIGSMWEAHRERKIKAEPTLAELMRRTDN